MVIDQNLKGLGGGQSHKILNILNRTQPYCKFSHKKHSPELYKEQFIVYNRGGRIEYGTDVPLERDADNYSSYL